MAPDSKSLLILGLSACVWKIPSSPSTTRLQTRHATHYLFLSHTRPSLPHPFPELSSFSIPKFSLSFYPPLPRCLFLPLLLFFLPSLLTPLPPRPPQPRYDPAADFSVRLSVSCWTEQSTSSRVRMPPVRCVCAPVLDSKGKLIAIMQLSQATPLPFTDADIAHVRVRDPAIPYVYVCVPLHCLVVVSKFVQLPLCLHRLLTRLRT